MKLLVRNLNRLMKEEELKKMFQKFGSVQSCHLIIDAESGLSKGFGFIEMPKVGDAKAAIKNLNNQTIDSKKIRVKKANDKATQ